MQEPLISILVPFKNTEAYLSECLDSIVNQSYNNWELLIVDDSSSDTSYSLVHSYAQKDARIRLFKNPGKGIIEALRHGYLKSSGTFITRMDSDDIMRADKLKILSQHLLTHGEGYIAIGQVSYFAAGGVGAGYRSYEAWLNRLTKNGDNFSEIYKECVIPSPCWMLYRTDLEYIQAFKPNRYPEDYDLTFRCYEAGLKCIPCQEVLHDWRDYPDRASRTHIHYAQNHFLDIKLHYFLKLNHDVGRPLVVWGAGLKGKTIVKVLLDKDIPFYWICDNPKKIGRDIYGKTLKNFEFLETLVHPQSIITVANKVAQKEINAYMIGQNSEHMQDYFFFC